MSVAALEQIAALHPHALVAWDRAGLEFPDGGRVWNWRGASAWADSDGKVHNDGIGSITRPSIHPFGPPTWRAVLVRDLRDPLGVSWWVDPGSESDSHKSA